MLHEIRKKLKGVMDENKDESVGQKCSAFTENKGSMMEKDRWWKDSSKENNRKGRLVCYQIEKSKWENNENVYLSLKKQCFMPSSRSISSNWHPLSHLAVSVWTFLGYTPRTWLYVPRINWIPSLIIFFSFSNCCLISFPHSSSVLIMARGACYCRDSSACYCQNGGFITTTMCQYSVNDSSLLSR